MLREKIELENQLEQEEEYIVNELQKKLSKLQAEKAALEARLLEERESHETLRKTQSQLAKAQQQNADLQKELLSVRSENFGLTQRISKEQQLLQSIATEKAMLEHGLEMETERAFNLEQRRLMSPDGGDSPSRPGGRHRTRSQSLPVHDPEAPTHLHPRPSGTGIPITAVSVPGSSSNMARSNSGSLHGSQESTGSSSSSSAGASPSTRNHPAITATSPPTSPRTSGTGASPHHSPSSSLDVTLVPGAASPTTLSPSSSGVTLANSGGGRSRRLSFAQNASLMAQYPTTPRTTNTTAVVLKQGWMRSTHQTKLVDPQAEEYDVDPEPATDLFFILSDDSTLVAWMNEMRGDDGTGSLFCINLDTVLKRSQDLDSGELILETKDSIYNLRPQSEDLKEWCELLEQLDPLASK